VIDTPRRAIGRCRRLTRYHADTPAMNQAAAISAPTSMCTNLIPNEGLKITWSQFVGWNCPSTTL
jgi:hypothetical protein